MIFISLWLRCLAKCCILTASAFYILLYCLFFKAVCFKLCQGQNFFWFIGRFHSSFETSIAVKMLVYVRILGKLYDQWNEWPKVVRAEDSVRRKSIGLEGGHTSNSFFQGLVWSGTRSKHVLVNFQMMQSRRQLKCVPLRTEEKGMGWIGSKCGVIQRDKK